MLIIPFGDDNVQGGHFPLFTYAFIGINILVFLYQTQLADFDLESFIYTFGTIPAEITTGHDYFTLVSSIFIHGGLAHIIGNMVFLWIFADNIEALIGSSRFFIFYILGGIAGSLGHIYFNADSIIPTVGASGAIAAVMGAYMVLFPQSRIKIFIFIFFTTIPAFILLGFWIITQLVSGIQDFNVATAQTEGIAYWAHIIGFIFGVMLGIFWRSQDALQGSYIPQSGPEFALRP